MFVRTVSVGVVLLLVGCGGDVTRDGRDEPSSAGSAGASSGAGGKDGFNWDSPLPECKPGFAPSEAAGRPCNWYANGRCFEKRDDACGCECRRTNGSICSSGFPDPDGWVQLTCL
ncbi:MAG: hypothetical protein R3B13_09190 [Polyangiaceae bacterium]